MKPQNIAIVGATGAVGVEILRVLERRNFPVASLKLLASARSVGKTLEFKGKPHKVEELKADAFKGCDIAFFSAGATRSREFVPAAKAAGCVVIDNSSAFRMDPNTPLVVPEVNPHDIAKYKARHIIANPNCSTAIALMGLYPLHLAFGLKRFFASTYQAVSGTGAEAMRELDAQALHERDRLEDLAAARVLTGERLHEAREFGEQQGDERARDEFGDAATAGGLPVQGPAVEALHEPGLGLGEERADEAGDEMLLEVPDVRIDPADDVAAARVDRLPHRVALAAARTGLREDRRLGDDAGALPGRGLGGEVGRAVVDDDALEVAPRLRKDRRNGFRNVTLGLIERDDDADGRVRHWVLSAARGR